MAVNRYGDVIYPSLAWWENYPAAALPDDVHLWLDSQEHYSVSGMRSRPNQSPERLSWIRQQHPDLWKKIDQWVDFGSYTMWALNRRMADLHVANNPLASASIYNRCASMNPRWIGSNCAPKFSRLRLTLASTAGRLALRLFPE
ncbi:Uncharacterised protein [Raoultella terrigena]|uniref:Uncharacterized protein n=1 Tax=Raoultella terrigena TaxID=577 RepID=A0A4U9DBP9_RAOTE|nr:Uncharacterised protein [Raoultella terrigena]